MLLPELPLNEWQDTKMTLHLFLQIAGKIKLKKMPRKNHWWNITLLINSRGISTQAISNGAESFEIQFDFIKHVVVITTSTGGITEIELRNGLSVADFYTQINEALKKLSIEADIVARPYSLPDDDPITTPFAELNKFSSYDKVYVERFWKVMLWVNNVFVEFSGRFYGKTCPVQLYWHHMDLTVTRFSGKKLPLPEGMSVQNKDAYSHEVVSFGFWAGDDKVPAPAFYSYTYPSPEGLEKTTLQPDSATWQMSNGSPMALLMYDDIRLAENPKQELLDFLQSAYEAGARLGNWDIEAFKVPELEEL